MAQTPLRRKNSSYAKTTLTPEEPFTPLIDMDDVLCNLVQPWMSILEQRFKIKIDFEDLNGWNLGEILPAKYPVLTSSRVYAPLDEPGFFRNLPIMPGVKAVLEEMKHMGWRPVIVTSLPIVKHNPGQVIQEKCEWIEENLSGLIEPRNVVITYKKFLVRGDALVDDAPHNLEQFPGHTVAVNKPWNKEVKVTARIDHFRELPYVCNPLNFSRRLNER
jgi:5'-nucleotidase